jgi:hypothetical protein
MPAYCVIYRKIIFSTYENVSYIYLYRKNDAAMSWHFECGRYFCGRVRHDVRTENWRQPNHSMTSLRSLPVQRRLTVTNGAALPGYDHWILAVNRTLYTIPSKNGGFTSIPQTRIIVRSPFGTASVLTAHVRAACNHAYIMALYSWRTQSQHNMVHLIAVFWDWPIRICDDCKAHLSNNM